MKLSQKDYKLILNYYNIKFKDLTPNDIKEQAENILAKKMCRCIKKIQKTTKKENASEIKAISICKNSVITKKKLKNFGFTCKKKIGLIPQKGTTTKLVKINRTLKINNTRNK